MTDILIKIYLGSNSYLTSYEKYHYSQRCLDDGILNNELVNKAIKANSSHYSMDFKYIKEG